MLTGFLENNYPTLQMDVFTCEVTVNTPEGSCTFLLDQFVF
jgi:hypothetical protein